MRTNSILMLLVATVLFMGGCKYEFPLTTEHRIPIDSIVLGLWEMVPDDKENPDERERMIVLRYSDTEYLIHFPNMDEGMYFRGYPVKIGEVQCVQLQAIGTKDGPMANSVKRLFDVASYEIANGELIVRTLNTDLVDASVNNPEALKAAMLKHKENQELFTHPGRFRRL